MTDIRLLILDDEAAVADTVRMIAEDAGVEARVALEAQAFFEAFDQWQPTHLAIDLVMPGMDGVEVMGGPFRGRARTERGRRDGQAVLAFGAARAAVRRCAGRTRTRRCGAGARAAL